MNNEQKRDALRGEITKAVTGVMSHNDLDLNQQIEVLAEMFLNVLHLYGELNAQEPTEFAQNLLLQLVKINNPDYSPTVPVPEASPSGPMQPRRNEGSATHRGGRISQPDPANSWLRVFPVPLTADKLLSYLYLLMGGEDKFDPKKLPNKMQGVLLTSMPEADRAYIKQHMKELGLVAVSKADDHRLRYVVFGAGEQASRKTAIIADRIAHQELIDGIYFEHFMDVLDELTDMAELHDADQYAKQAPADYDPTMEDRERIAQENGDTIDDLPPREGSGQDGDDLPF